MTVIVPNVEMHRKAATFLPQPKLIIGAEERETGGLGRIVHVNNSTDEEQGEIPLGGAEDIDDAVRAARGAFPAWRDMAPAERRRMMDRLCDLVEANGDRFCQIGVVENGVPMMNMLHGIVPRTNEWLRYYSGWADKIEGQVTGMNPGTCFEYTVAEPYGVIGQIITWNAPLLSLAMKLAPALAAGNTVVVKPSELTPYSSQLFFELAREAGFPAGVINIVPGGVEAGEALVKHPDVDKISFTGGPGGARAIMHAAAENLRPCVFELGGKSANIIFPDIDIASTAAHAAGFGFNNSGQGCALPTRLIVHEAIYEDFNEALAAVTQAIPNGDPMDESVVVGPMVNRAASQRVLGMIDEARQQKAGKIVTGGVQPEGISTGSFVSPTLIIDADPHSRIAQTEIFGPVLAVMKFSNEAEAVELANATQYGLAAFVQTNDFNIVQRMVRELKTGAVYVNEALPAGLAASPFGGQGLSGFGREGGRAGLEEYIRPKGIAMSVTARS